MNHSPLRDMDQWVRQLALLVLVVFGASLAGQSKPNPSTFKLTTSPPITLDYVGAFRLPRDVYPAVANPSAYPAEFVDKDAFEFGGGIVGFDKATNSLVVSSRRNRVALVSIPTPSKATSIEELPFAQLRPGKFIDPSGRSWGEIQDGEGYAGLGGGMVIGDTFFYTGINFYDANNITRRAFRAAQWPLTEPPVQRIPWRAVGSDREQGMSGGYFIAIPERHQARLGGSVMTGLQSVSVQFRTSAGPVGYAWNPAALLKGNAPAKMLVGYPLNHWTLGPWEGHNPFYGISTQIYGGTFVGDWLMFWGMNGGTHCYGNATGDKSKVGQPIPGSKTGEKWDCYDPVTSAKANHGYPYRWQQYAYKVGDLADVAAGKRDPWSLTPIVWAYDQPFSRDDLMKKLGGIVEDDKGNIYVSQLFSDVDGYSSRATILVYRAEPVGSR